MALRQGSLQVKKDWAVLCVLKPMSCEDINRNWLWMCYCNSWGCFIISTEGTQKPRVNVQLDNRIIACSTLHYESLGSISGSTVHKEWVCCQCNAVILWVWKVYTFAALDVCQALHLLHHFCYLWNIKCESRALQCVSMHVLYRHDLPFCTLSQSRKISSPPLQLPELRLTRQIFSSAVFGAPVRHKR